MRDCPFCSGYAAGCFWCREAGMVPGYDADLEPEEESMNAPTESYLTYLDQVKVMRADLAWNNRDGRWYCHADQKVYGSDESCEKAIMLCYQKWLQAGGKRKQVMTDAERQEADARVDAWHLAEAERIRAKQRQICAEAMPLSEAMFDPQAFVDGMTEEQKTNVGIPAAIRAAQAERELMD